MVLDVGYYYYYNSYIQTVHRSNYKGTVMAVIV